MNASIWETQNPGVWRPDNRGLRAPSVAGSASAFWALVLATARAKLAYRLSTFMAALSSVLGLGIYALVWMAAYRNAPGAQAVPQEQLFPYLVVALVVHSTLTLAVETRFGIRLSQGLVVIDLLRPLGFMPFQMAQALGDVVGNSTFAVPIYLAGLLLVGHGGLPPDGPHLLCGLLSFWLAFWINFAVSYLWLQVTFVTNSFYGMVQARVALHQMFSGIAAPLAAFPAVLRQIGECLPFRDMIETPVRIWLGHAPLDVVPTLLARQAAWAVGVSAVAALLFRAAVRRHQSQAG